MDISIVICAHNRAEVLRQAFLSIGNLSVPEGVSLEVVAVDNNSSDNTKDVIEKFENRKEPQIHYVFEPVKSKSVSLNKGAREAKGEILIFIDSDMVLDKGYLKAVLNGLNRYPDINVFCGKIINQWPFPKPEWIITDGLYRNIDSIIGVRDQGNEDAEARKINMALSIGNAFFRKKIFQSNLFRGDLGPRGGKMGYGEDAEFFARIHGQGEKIMYIHDAITYHNIEPHKINKNYFLKRKFKLGYYDAKYIKYPSNTKYWFGVPRYLFRQMIEAFFMWNCSLNPSRRFFYRLRLNYILGQIKSMVFLSKDKQEQL